MRIRLELWVQISKVLAENTDNSKALLPTNSRVKSIVTSKESKLSLYKINRSLEDSNRAKTGSTYKWKDWLKVFDNMKTEIEIFKPN